MILKMGIHTIVFQCSRACSTSNKRIRFVCKSRSINADKRNLTWQLHQKINRQIIKIEVKEFSASAQFMSIRFRCSNGFYDVRTKLRFSFLTLQLFLLSVLKTQRWTFLDVQHQFRHQSHPSHMLYHLLMLNGFSISIPIAQKQIIIKTLKFLPDTFFFSTLRHFSCIHQNHKWFFFTVSRSLSTPRKSSFYILV